MAFKDRARRFFGIKTEEELRQKKSAKQKTKEFFESLLFAGLAAAVIITFIIQNTRIPTGSMENTILVGDFVLVNKFIFGASSPRYIPFTDVALPFFTLPSVREPRPKDIVVFEYPGDRDQLVATPPGVSYVKRLIGMPGDTVQIIDKVVFVNHREFWIPSYTKYIKPFTRPNDYPEPRIFPKGMPWNEDNYGPLIIPKKGSVVNLSINNVEQWRTLIDREFGRRVVRSEGSVVYIDNVAVKKYTFKKDYYFMIGDNRDDSLDSRFWGFVPRDLVLGQAFITLFSWDREIPFSQIIKLLASSRPDRILKVLD